MNKSLIAIIVVLIVGAGIFFFNRPQQSGQTTNPQSETDSTPRMDTEVLAGKSSYLYNYSKDRYDDALASDKLVVLYFYANWCSICKEEIPDLYGAFNELTSDKVIGFRINFNDSDTDSQEQELASEYGVAYQHTKVFVKNGQRVLKSPESWDKQRYLEEINSQVSK